MAAAAGHSNAMARTAGVQPSTMTRLAKFLKLDGYEDIRSDHARAIRLRAEGFAAQARAAARGRAWRKVAEYPQ
ncbi:hypothetical protein DPM13_12785 [Paracoccus mutanolyticus]|uniref:HTH rpiR-type domain-containing protein n=2 Tax=Paracoccus mutanolyticus TaxID=1499308 RepID=A0ABM6WSH3_9RHOB|nr:hypothetical protein DPM13_12785 [Paracoccus mutanolyticus]